MAQHLITITTHGTVEPIEMAFSSARALRKIAAGLTTQADLASVHVRIDGSARNGGAEVIEVACDRGWSYS